MSIEGMEPQEGEYLAKEPDGASAMSVTHITNNVVVQNMNVHLQPDSVDTSMDDSVELTKLPTQDDEISQLAEQDLDALLNRHFKGKVVRKDLTKQLKEGANVPVYVLEYLLGMYCASDDDDVVRQGLENVKKILAENYVRPDEAEKV